MPWRCQPVAREAAGPRPHPPGGGRGVGGQKDSRGLGAPARHPTRAPSPFGVLRPLGVAWPVRGALPRPRVQIGHAHPPGSHHFGAAEHSPLASSDPSGNCWRGVLLSLSWRGAPHLLVFKSFAPEGIWVWLCPSRPGEAILHPLPFLPLDRWSFWTRRAGKWRGFCFGLVWAF